MGSPLLARALLLLYPGAFRRRFEPEWWELVEWHRRGLAGVPFSGTRLALLLLFDTLRTLPGVYASAMSARLRGGSSGGWGREARHAVHALVRHPVFTLAAVLSVAVGVGANVATFSVVNTVLLRPLPYEDPERLAIVWNEFPSSERTRLPLTGPQVQVLREEPDLFERVEAIWSMSGSVVARDGRTAQVSLAFATPGLFDLLGVSPALGRDWARDGVGDGEAPDGVMISDELWRGRFGGDRSLVGSTIDMDGWVVPVIGVLPPDFVLHLPEDGSIPPRPDVYLALPWDLSSLQPGQRYLRVVGKLRPDVDRARAAAGVAAAGERALATYPELQRAGDRLSVHPLHGDAVRAARPALLALLGAVVLFLLLASANVASLILARTLSRTREMAIRSAIGATPGRLAGLVVLESLMVSGAGALLGAWLGFLGASALWSLRPTGLARVSSVPFDARVLVFALALLILTSVASTLASLIAVRALARSLGVRGAGATSSRTARRAREIVTAGQVAAGLVLVVGSALMIRSVATLGRESIGFDPSSRLTFKLPITESRFSTDGERARVAAEVERRVSEIPGVRAVGATSHLPFAPWANWAQGAPPVGTPAEERGAYFADLRAVTPDFFSAVGASLVAGRFFEDSDDTESEPVVIMDETMASRAFPGGDAVGRRVDTTRYFGGQFTPAVATVVGVIRDIRDRGPSEPSTGQVFWPFAQSARWELTFFVRAAGDPAALATEVERAVRAADPELAPANLSPMDDYVAGATAFTRFLALVGTWFSALALLVAAIGLYGVVAFVTIQRTHELGMRLVLGASRRDLLARVLAHGLRVGAIGVGVGLAGTVVLARFLSGLVYGVSPYDPATLAGVALLLMAVAVVASLAPARRAMRADPLSAVREA